jgi:GGDEF domain-containing protein
VVGGLSVRVKPSVGIAVYPDDALTPADLLEKADAAMYAAKREGKGYVFWNQLRAP